MPDSVDNRRRWKQVFQRVRQVLLDLWHPIGFAVPSDEYDSYALVVTGMLLRQRTTPVEVEDYLSCMERDMIGAVNASQLKATVDALMQLRQTD